MYEYAAKIVNVIDADTVDLEIDLGFRVKMRDRFRLYGPNPDGPMGLDAPEMRTPEGKAAKAFLMKLFDGQWTELRVQTVKDSRCKYGRYLAVILAKNGAGAVRNFNQLLLDAGHAKLVKYS